MNAFKKSPQNMHTIHCLLLISLNVTVTYCNAMTDMYHSYLNDTGLGEYFESLA